MNVFEINLSERETAYIRLLAHHMNQFKALLTDLAGPPPPPVAESNVPPVTQYTRELALANTRLEEAYYHAREHVLRSASKRNGVN